MARSESMSNARRVLVMRWGESYGQTMFADMLQRFWLSPTDEVTDAMWDAVHEASRTRRNN